jgi:serine palmitoyltransferase
MLRRRMMDGKSLSRLSDGVPGVEASSQSTGAQWDPESDDEFMGNDVYIYDERSLGTDPYQDVRERMEGLASNDRAMHASHTMAKGDAKSHEELSIPALTAMSTYLAYSVLIMCGRIRDICAALFGGRYVRKASAKPIPSDNRTFFAPIVKSWENFYTRRLYHRIQDCWNRPIASNPGAHIEVLERVSTDGQKTMKLAGPIGSIPDERIRKEYADGEFYTEAHTGAVARKCLNLGSYNYLGFADDWKNTCQDDVLGSLEKFSVSAQASRIEFGTTALHRELETTVARFLSKEDALVLTMGFNTNATTIPALVGRGDLIISDELNHTSIVNGARASGAAIRIFRHNDIAHLEETIREAIVMGRPRTRRPWGKIMVIVEGIYSMEGEYCDLRNVVKVCKKYGVYTYLDEAHSIGAMGKTGRGCAEYTGVNTSDVDIMMGTFTKSFGGMGGYIAASKDVIAHLRWKCAGSSCHNSLSPPVCQQVITSFRVSERYMTEPWLHLLRLVLTEPA